MRTTTLHRWRMRLPLPFSKGIERGGAVFTGGQCDLDADGRVLHAGNPVEQIRATVANGLEVLGDLGLGAAHIVAARCFVVGLEPARAASVLADSLGAAGAPDAEVSIVPLRTLYYDGLVAEMDFVACIGARSDAPLGMIGAFEGRAELSNAEAMMADVLSNLDARLRTADADRGALVRLGFQWPLEITAAAFGVAEQIRRAWFGADAPVFSDLRLPISRLRLDALFVGRSLRSHARRPLRPDDGLDNDALAVGPVLVTRGIAFPDEKTSLLRQTQACMDRLDAVLDAAGFAWSDIAKMSTYYVGGSSAEELHENLALRAARFSAPGPASTGVPVPGLPRAGEKIAVEAIAVREVQQ